MLSLLFLQDMNLLRQCTFIDRTRDSFVELDDILEERHIAVSRNIDTQDPWVSRQKEPTTFHLLLYFTANWLPDNCNRELNKKLSSFYGKESVRRQFELIFVSSDKTAESYNKFLSENKFIRYALAFQEQEIKVSKSQY